RLISVSFFVVYRMHCRLQSATRPHISVGALVVLRMIKERRRMLVTSYNEFIRRQPMNHWVGALTLVILLAVNGFAAQQNVSVDVEETTLSRLIRLFDQATGLHSTVPPELADRTVSVRFSGLGVEDALRKIFENLPLDYVFIGGQGIVVTGVSEENVVTSEPVPVYEETSEGTPLIPERQLPKLPPESPVEHVIPTPFGFILQSPGQNGLVQLPPLPGEAPGPPFFFPQQPPRLPAGAANGPVQNELFRPISIY